jgi:hypothetical protein
MNIQKTAESQKMPLSQPASQPDVCSEGIRNANMKMERTGGQNMHNRLRILHTGTEGFRYTEPQGQTWLLLKHCIGSGP